MYVFLQKILKQYVEYKNCINMNLNQVSHRKFLKNYIIYVLKLHFFTVYYNTVTIQIDKID